MPIVPKNRTTPSIILDPLRRDIVPRRRTPPANDREPVAPHPVPLPELAAQEPASARKVGKGHPPVEHQFKPGQSGNPNGRPKGAKGVVPQIRDLLEAKQSFVIAGREQKMTRREALLLKRFERAMTKSEHSADYLLNKYEASQPVIGLPDARPPIDDATNHAILAAVQSIMSMGEPIGQDDDEDEGGDHVEA